MLTILYFLMTVTNSIAGSNSYLVITSQIKGLVQGSSKRIRVHVDHVITVGVLMIDLSD